MGRFLLVGRLAMRDLRRRPVEAALLSLAIMAATTTLTLGHFLHEAGSNPYQSTREATAGPDVIASTGPNDGTPADVASLEALTDAPGVIGHSGPYPMIGAELEASGGTAGVWAEGRNPAETSIEPEAGWPTIPDASGCSKRSVAHQGWSLPCCSRSMSSSPSSPPRRGSRPGGWPLPCSPIVLPVSSATQGRRP